MNKFKSAPAILPFASGRACRLTPLAAAVVAALNPASPALAQSDGELEEIIVTATRRASNLQDVAQSITAFTTADIERQGFQNMEDYMKSLPSMNLVNLMPGRNSVIMRGVSTGSAEYRTDSQVAVYLDEQPMTSISQQVDVRMVDIARIESLPGPQGTLFGSSSQSGTLRIITNKPDYTGFSGQATTVIGTTKGGDESYDLNGHLNIPIIDDRLAIRAVGFTTRDGGYVDNVLGMDLAGINDNSAVVEENFNKYSTTGGRLAILWNITDKWELSGNYIVQNSTADGAWETDPSLGDYKISRFFDEYRNDDWYQTSMTLTGDLGFAELSFTASDFSRDIDYEWDNMAYEQWKDAYWGAYYPLYNSDYTFGTIFNFQVQDRYSLEARLTSQGESRLQWMVGAFYEDVYDRWHYGALNPDLTSTTAWEAANYYAYLATYYGYDVQYPLPATDVAYLNTYAKTIKQTAIFGEVTYNLTYAFSVTGGMRWFEYDRDEYDLYEFPAGLPVWGAWDDGGVLTRQGVSNDVVMKFGTEYHLDDERMMYFLYSEGFRLGGTNSARAASTGNIPLEYGPDSLQNYELGLKSQWLNQRLQLNASLFYMEWDDIQLNETVEGGPWWQRGTTNAGKAEQKGIEVSGWFNFTDNFFIEGSVFVADPEFPETFVRTNGGVIEAGTSMPNSPKRKYWAALQYTVPDIGWVNGDLWFRYDISYQSESWSTLTSAINRDPEGIYPSWQSTNFQIGLNLENDWDISLMARNLWDERNTNFLWRPGYGEFFGDSRHNNFRSFQRPRTINLTVRKRF
jgi:iron complex outermembrane recepter protein